MKATKYSPAGVAGSSGLSGSGTKQTRSTKQTQEPGPHARIGLELGKLVDRKDRAYGQAVAIVPALLRLLYPDGIRPEQYLEAALIVRIEDKICRIARGDPRAFKESPFKDIAWYALRGIEMEGEEDL